MKLQMGNRSFLPSHWSMCGTSVGESIFLTFTLVCIVGVACHVIVKRELCVLLSFCAWNELLLDF